MTSSSEYLGSCSATEIATMAEPTGEPSRPELQQLYVDLLHKYCIISLLDCPINVFEQLCIQEIETVLKDPDRLRKQVSSCRLLKQQSTTLMKILTKTNYKELRRVEAAVRKGIQNDHKKELKEELEGNVENAFEGIALELKLVAKEAINFLPVISGQKQEQDDERRPSSTSTSPSEAASASTGEPASTSAGEAASASTGEPASTSAGEAASASTGEPASTSAGKSASASEVVSEFDPLTNPMTKTLQQQLFFSLVKFEHRKELKEFLANPEVKKEEVWVYCDDDEDYSILHEVAINSSQNTDWAIEFMTTVMKFIDENDDFPWSAQEFINYPRKDGCTALHLAILFGSIRAVECLIDLGADMFLRDQMEDSSQDFMYDMMPEALLCVLTSTGVISQGNPQDKSVVVRLDFGTFVDRVSPYDDDHWNETLREGTKTDSQNANENPKIGDAYIPVEGDEKKSCLCIDDDKSSFSRQPEMENLANAIYRYSKTAAPQLLGHVVVKIFLDLKWIKLKWPIYFLTLFYIAVYISYTAFAVYVFIVKFPYAPDKNNVTATGNASQPSETWNQKGIEILPAATVTLASAALLYVGLEIWQYFLILSVATNSRIKALLFYLHDFENVLQLLFMIGAFSVAGVVYAGQPEAQDWSYWFAAFSIVVAWILILLQLGNFYGLGKYVYMFQTVFKRFATVMASLYLCFLIGFTIAFSIIFPEDKFFSFPRSFFRTFAMMTGELNFDDVFDPEESRPFEFAALAIYLGFTIIVTIVIVNLLVGLTIDDVGKIFKEADAIHREIQVERLYILEHMLYRFCKDTFVVSPERRIYAAVVDTEMGQFSRDLRQELRCLLADPEKYKKEYLQLG